MKKGNKTPKVAILTCTQSAQRINYYNSLGKLCVLSVIAERETPSEILDAYNVKRENYKVIQLRGIPMFGYMAFCPGVNIVLKKRSFDVVIVEQYATPTALFAINYMYKHKIPFIISADGGFTCINEKKSKYYFKKYIISKAALWITGGKGSVDYLMHYGAAPERTKIFRFSPYSINDQPKHEMTEEEKSEVRDGLNIFEKKVIISAGQQIHRKGFDILIEAVRDLGEDIGIYIIGGKPNDECKKLLEIHPNKNIHFPGKVSKDILKEYYKAADIFVFPTRYDIWGYPINEAMSFGLPIVTTKQCNAGLELIENGINGYLIEAEDVDGLRKVIIKLLNDSGLSLEMGNRNYIKSKYYTSETMAEDVFFIINNFYENHSRQAR